MWNTFLKSEESILLEYYSNTVNFLKQNANILIVLQETAGKKAELNYQPTNGPLMDTEPYKIFTMSVMKEVFEQYDFAKNQLKLIDRVEYIFEDMYNHVIMYKKEDKDETLQNPKFGHFENIFVSITLIDMIM